MKKPRADNIRHEKNEHPNPKIPQFRRRVIEFIDRADLKDLLRLAIEAERAKKTTLRREKANRSPCGAKTRSGGECRAKVLWNPLTQTAAKRCRLHGGLSTGPTTSEGKTRLAEAAKKHMLKIWQERREGKRPAPVRKAVLDLKEAGLTDEEIGVLAEAFASAMCEGGFK